MPRPSVIPGIKARLEALHPGCRVDLLGMTTRGDQILDRPLAKVGGKGLFVKELETALLDGRADIAVHSMKDVPMVMEPEFALPCITAREVPLDAFVSSRYESLADMPPGAVVGTSSLRRESQIHAQYPFLGVTSLRGNLDTRLRKLDEGQYDAIILAAAGLTRLGLGERIRSVMPAEVSLPAAGQGALGIECHLPPDELLPFDTSSKAPCSLAYCLPITFGSRLMVFQRQPPQRMSSKVTVDFCWAASQRMFTAASLIEFFSSFFLASGATGS